MKLLGDPGQPILTREFILLTVRGQEAMYCLEPTWNANMTAG
jgi:hypothetical protein